jgi:DNA processing protein
LLETAQRSNGELSPLQKKLVQLLRLDESLHIDEVIQQMEENSPSEIIAALCELELAGCIRQLPGRQYVRVW